MLRNFFCGGAISPPRALIWDKKPGKNRRLLRKSVEYSQLGACKILFAPSSAQCWVFRRRARSGDHFRSPMTKKLKLSVATPRPAAPIIKAGSAGAAVLAKLSQPELMSLPWANPRFAPTEKYSFDSELVEIREIYFQGSLKKGRAGFKPAPMWGS